MKLVLLILFFWFCINLAILIILIDLFCCTAKQIRAHALNLNKVPGLNECINI